VFKLNNITLQEFIDSNDFYKYDSVLQHQKGKNIFLGKECNILSKPYTDIKYCISLLRSLKSFDDVIEVISILTEKSKEEVLKSDIVEYYSFRNYIINTFKQIQDNESKLAKSTNTDAGKWIMAGGDKLKPYDDVLPLDQLAERYGGYPFDFGRKPYSEIFYLMAMTKTLNEVNINYSKQK